MVSRILAVGLMAAASVACAVPAGTASKKAPKKLVVTKYEEAVAEATASGRPILVVCSRKGLAQDDFLSKQLLKNPVFIKELVKPNLVVWNLQCPIIKQGGFWPSPQGLSSNAVNLLNHALRSPRVATDKNYEHLYPGVALVDSTGTKTIGAYLRPPQLQQPRADTPFNTWMQAFVYFCEGQKVPLTISPALKKYMETDPGEASAGKKKKK